MSKPDIYGPDETITPEGLETKRKEVHALLEGLDYGPKPDDVEDLYRERASDLLTNIMHACRAEGIDFDALLERAQRNFNAETPEADAPTL